jgi:hypothetical protein
MNTVRAKFCYQYAVVKYTRKKSVSHIVTNVYVFKGQESLQNIVL